MGHSLSITLDASNFAIGDSAAQITEPVTLTGSATLQDGTRRRGDSIYIGGTGNNEQPVGGGVVVVTWTCYDHLGLSLAVPGVVAKMMCLIVAHLNLACCPQPRSKEMVKDVRLRIEGTTEKQPARVACRKETN